MDAAGAAIATAFAQAVSVLFAVVILLKKELPFSIAREDVRINPQYGKFLGIGLPLALQEFLTQLSFLALCAFVNRLGLTASSGYGIASKIVNFAMLIPSALMRSMASFVAQNVGAGNQQRTKKPMFTGIGVGLVFGCVVFVLVFLKGDALATIFSTDAEVVQKGFEYLKGFAPGTIVTAVLFSMVGYFNGNNQTLWVMIQGIVQTPDVIILHEHSAGCQSGKDRPCSAHIHSGRDRPQYCVLHLLEQKERRFLSAHPSKRSSCHKIRAAAHTTSRNGGVSWRNFQTTMQRTSGCWTIFWAWGAAATW